MGGERARRYVEVDGAGAAARRGGRRGCAKLQRVGNVNRRKARKKIRLLLSVQTGPPCACAELQRVGRRGQRTRTMESL
jgi:hypothetical protein